MGLEAKVRNSVVEYNKDGGGGGQKKDFIEQLVLIISCFLQLQWCQLHISFELSHWLM